MRKLESNEDLRLTLESLQMPTVEYKEVHMEDYSRCRQKRDLCARLTRLHAFASALQPCLCRSSNPPPSRGRPTILCC